MATLRTDSQTAYALTRGRSLWTKYVQVLFITFILIICFSCGHCSTDPNAYTFAIADAATRSQQDESRRPGDDDAYA